MIISLVALTVYPVEYSGSIMQPHHKEVLYTFDGGLFAELTVEDCVAKFRRLRERYGPFTLEMTMDIPNRTWLVRFTDDTGPLIYVFRQDIVDVLMY